MGGFFKKVTKNSGGAKKRGGSRRNEVEQGRGKKKPRKVVEKVVDDDDEEILSDEEDEIEADSPVSTDIDDDADLDDVNEKSKREAKRLLEKIADAEESEESDEDKEDEKPPKEDRRIAEHIRFGGEEGAVVYAPHLRSPVCVCFSSDERYIVSCSKDGSVVKYDLSKREKCGVIKLSKKQKDGSKAHKGAVTCCAISPDDKYLATGGADATVKIWSFDTLEHVKDFTEHRGAVTSLTFRKVKNTTELFSASADRSVKAWNLDQMGFVDTMYGHLDSVQQLDMLITQRVLACGGQDRSVRLFKIAEESQLVFNGFTDAICIDTVALINENHFFSGAIDGIYVWSAARKKPVCVVRQAHGVKDDSPLKEPHWICSVAACPYTDLAATGSSDGVLRLWKCAENYKSLEPIDQFKINGFVNDIKFTANAQRLVCAVGQEHKNGRWFRLPKAKNMIIVIPLIGAE